MDGLSQPLSSCGAAAAAIRAERAHPVCLPSTAPASRPRYPSGYAGFTRRCLEFDAPTDDYARFLNHEILPWVCRTHGVRVTNDPSRRAVAGQSSGAAAVRADLKSDLGVQSRSVVRK